MALKGLEGALTVLTKRAQVLAGNLANANTPDYRRWDVPFYSVMRRFLESGAMPMNFLTARPDFSPLTRADGNNTSPERELSALTETALLYRVTLQLVAKELEQLRSAITEGRR